jgi:uncharacterized membrane protein YbaN (DUF454 family)
LVGKFAPAMTGVFIPLISQHPFFTQSQEIFQRAKVKEKQNFNTPV